MQSSSVTSFRLLLQDAIEFSLHEGSNSRSRTDGPHSMRRTKATRIYRRTKNLQALQLLLGHAKLESTVRCLDIEVNGALEIFEQTGI